VAARDMGTSWHEADYFGSSLISSFSTIGQRIVIAGAFHQEDVCGSGYVEVSGLNCIVGNRDGKVMETYLDLLKCSSTLDELLFSENAASIFKRMLLF
jgi:hypothetical protein